jgi:hypothetical protein
MCPVRFVTYVSGRSRPLHGRDPHLVLPGPSLPDSVTCSPLAILSLSPLLKLSIPLKKNAIESRPVI